MILVVVEFQHFCIVQRTFFGRIYIICSICSTMLWDQKESEMKSEYLVMSGSFISNLQYMLNIHTNTRYASSHLNRFSARLPNQFHCISVNLCKPRMRIWIRLLHIVEHYMYIYCIWYYSWIHRNCVVCIF